MPQYTVFPTDASYVEVEDATGMKFRLQHSAATNTLSLIQTLNSHTGFAGVINVDYATIESYVLPTFPGALHRVGVRDAHWTIDQTYDPDVFGFDGEEGFEWDQISEHQL